jgi:hypothetical protein
MPLKFRGNSCRDLMWFVTIRVIRVQPTPQIGGN